VEKSIFNSKRGQRWLRRLAVSLSALASLFPLCLIAADAEPIHAGLAFDQFSLTLEPGERTEAFGPFYYSQTNEVSHSWGIPPFFSYTRFPDTEATEVTFAYPLFKYRRYGEQYRWDIGELFSFAGGPLPDEKDRHRFTLFPIYFQQRSSVSNENYTAVVPFYGTFKNRLWRDEVHFVMFPGYSRSLKKGVVTENYMYPFFHLRHGSGVSGWQLWPLIGNEYKSVTTKTNGFGDFEVVGGYNKSFVLWPFYFDQESGLGTDNPQRFQATLPFYFYLRSPLRDSTTVLWPFFSKIEDREKGYTEWQVPWPFVVFSDGAARKVRRFWPFYAHAQNTNLVSDWYMWPAYRHQRLHSPPLDRERKRVFYFLYNDVIDRNTATGNSRRRVSLWPFFLHRRDLDGNTRLQVLAILEPFLAENQHIEREYSPVYSFWRSEKNPKTGASSQSLLWNLYRRRTTPETSEVSFFFGLYQSKASPEGTAKRLFFIPLGKAPAKSQ
jgi:hypothetical protein